MYGMRQNGEASNHIAGTITYKYPIIRLSNISIAKM